MRITRIHYLRGRLPEQKTDIYIPMLYIHLCFIVFYSLTYRSLGNWNTRIARTHSSFLRLPEDGEDNPHAHLYATLLNKSTGSSTVIRQDQVCSEDLQPSVNITPSSVVMETMGTWTNTWAASNHLPLSYWLRRSTEPPRLFHCHPTGNSHQAMESVCGAGTESTQQQCRATPATGWQEKLGRESEFKFYWFPAGAKHI